jgi:hypothetical protein
MMGALLSMSLVDVMGVLLIPLDRRLAPKKLNPWAKSREFTAWPRAVANASNHEPEPSDLSQPVAAPVTAALTAFLPVIASNSLSARVRSSNMPGSLVLLMIFSQNRNHTQ